MISPKSDKHGPSVIIKVAGQYLEIDLKTWEQLMLSFLGYGRFHSHGGTPVAGWFIMENPNLKWKIYMISDNGNIGNPPEKGNIIDCTSIVDFSYWPSRAV